MAFKNIIDDTSTTVSANTPGVYLDLRYRTTLARASLGVPVRLWVYASSTVANDTGTVQILDSASAPQLTVPITGTTAKWYATDGYLPAADAKYDAVYGGNTLGTLSVLAFSLHEFADISPLEGVLAASIGEFTLAATGAGAAGSLAQSIGEFALTATGATVSDPPTYQALGTSQGGTGTATPAWPTHATGDVALLLVATFKGGSDPGAATLSDAQGFTSIVSDSTAGGFGDTYRLTAFWCRASSASMAAPTVADAHDSINAVIITFRGCVSSGDPVDVSSTASNASTNSSMSITGATTTGDNRLVVAVGGYGGTSTASSWANASLASADERIDNDNSEHIVCATGVMATAGAYAVTTATLTSSERWTGITIALKP